MSHDFFNDKRFEGLEPLKKRAFLSTPTPHKEEEMAYIEECYETGWLTTVGKNINELEIMVSDYMGKGKRAIALANGTTARKKRKQ